MTHKMKSQTLHQTSNRTMYPSLEFEPLPHDGAARLLELE